MRRFLIFVAAIFLCAQILAAEPLRGINATAWYTWPRFNGFDKAGLFWPPFPPNRKMPSANDLERIASLGFKSLRLGVDPALFMALEGQRKEQVKTQVLLTVQQALDAGLEVVFDLHPNSKHKIYGQKAYLKFDPEQRQAYVQAVGTVAAELSIFPRGRVWLELMNEPRMKCSGEDLKLWLQMLDEMINEATEQAPHVPLIISGACTSSIEGLLALDPGRWKRKDLMFTFHFYEPFPFTHQSAPFIAWPEKYLSGLPWPTQPDAQVRIEVSDLPEAEQGIANAKAMAVKAKYLSSLADAETIRERLSVVARWADEHEIARSRIFMGEFGVYRGTAERRGATCAARAAWLSDVTSAATDLGFSWAFFHLDGPFGILDETSHADEAALAALGLRAEGHCKTEQ